MKFYLRGESVCPKCGGTGYQPNIITTVRFRCDWCSGSGRFIGGVPDISSRPNSVR
jgi:DnaJ-class molecular chaperone